MTIITVFRVNAENRKNRYTLLLKSVVILAIWPRGVRKEWKNYPESSRSG